jgi:hypothetical protein
MASNYLMLSTLVQRRCRLLLSASPPAKSANLRHGQLSSVHVTSKAADSCTMFLAASNIAADGKYKVLLSIRKQL